MTRRKILSLTTAMILCGFSALAEVNLADYKAVTQGDLVGNRDSYMGKKVQVTGQFLFTGSDFCYQIRKTKINTKDYFCFALEEASPTRIRLYLKKNHPQADVLLNLKKGEKVAAYGTFDYVGADLNYVLIEKIAVEKGP